MKVVINKLVVIFVVLLCGFYSHGAPITPPPPPVPPPPVGLAISEYVLPAIIMVIGFVFLFFKHHKKSV